MNPCAKISPSSPQSSQISFVFENPLKAYFSGETVSGTVIFHARENQSVQTFSVHLRGEFYCKKGDTEHVESILEESSPVDLRGAGEGNVEAGFRLPLGPSAPTSLWAPLGGIRYRVLAATVLREGSAMRVAEASEPISVNRPLRLPASCSARRAHTTERAGLICCVGSISAELVVSSAFLLSGQPVLVEGSLFNATHSSVQATAISLVQSLQRHRDSKRMRRRVVSLQRGAVLPGKRQIWPSDLIVVPPLPPTSAGPFFKTWYEIVMEIQKLSGKMIKLKIPVVIGNLSATESSFPNASSEVLKIEWKNSEPQDEPDEFLPLYVTHVA